MLRIVDWEKNFENNRTREIKRLSWVPMPNKMDGSGYCAIMADKNSVEIFACWVAIVEVASRCDPRGSLLRGGKNGPQPLDSASLSLITRLPERAFNVAIPKLKEIGWLEEISQEGAGLPQESAASPQESASYQNRTEQNRTEQKELPPSPLKGGAALSCGTVAPYQKIVELYHSALPKLAKVNVISETLKKSIKCRWNEHPDLAWWEQYFLFVHESDFLMGRVKDFMADFAWLIGPKNMTNTLNGRYHQRGKPELNKFVGIARWLDKENIIDANGR